MSPCGASLREMTDVAIPYRFYPGQARWGAASVFQVDAREAGADLTEDFVADGVLAGGQVVRGDRGRALRAQQDRLVDWTDVREVRHVDHREVHADPPDDRHRPAADQHVPLVGQGAAVPVGIADRQDGQGRGTGRDERPAVADRLADADTFHLHDAGLPRERRPELGCGRRPVDVPVQHEAGTHAVEVAGREAQDRGGDAGVPKLLAFRDRGDAQLVRPGRQERACDGDGPVAVRVGLDDGDDGDRADTARNLTEVMTEGGQGNLDDRGIQISVISVSFFLRISSTLVMYESVSFWSSSWAFLASSSGIWEAFWPFLISSCTSRRMLRMWTRTSSAIFFACFASSLRRSSVSGGIGRRMSLPSFVGVRPRSEARIAFSMSLIILGSNGWTVRSRFSGAASVATCLRGVGVP